MKKNILYDIICIGAGPAGMTAAIYAGRSNYTVALIDETGFGGNIASSPKVENIPGFLNVSGMDFASNMFEQVCNLPTVEHFIDSVNFIDYKRGIFKVSTVGGDTYCGKTLIFATGSKHRELKVNTKDVYYCSTCDGPFFKDKNVLVVGSGNSGATYALDLAGYCNQVYICDITSEMCCEDVLKAQIKQTKNIKWFPDSTITSVTNNENGRLTSVTLAYTNTLEVSGIFAAIGLIPQTDIVGAFAKLDDNKYIVSDDCTTTEVPGVFVAGDCRTSKVKQVVTATSDGAVAAIEAMKYLKTLENRK